MLVVVELAVRLSVVGGFVDDIVLELLELSIIVVGGV